jgi:predicted phage-related endonuclease
MKQHNVIQGSPEWLQLRAQYFTASEAPAMMGCSPYMTRTELLNQKHTGLVHEVSSHTQRLFDSGHATEAKFRPIAEGMVEDDFYPVTGSLEVDGLKLLASYDGLTMDGTTCFEHKALNQSTAGHIDLYGEPPLHHVWQLEQQLLVSGAQRVLFVTSDGTMETAVHCMYTSQPDRRAALIAGWQQFAADLAVYVPSVIEHAKPTGQSPDTLPALHIEVTGMVTASNLDDFKATALTAIRGVNRELTTDQHFADAEKAVKWCEDIESRLKAAKEHALSQTATIDELFKALDDIAAEAKRTRLDLSKLVTSRKDAMRAQIIHDAQNVLTAHVMQLNLRIGKPLMPGIPADFAGVIKGKRSLDSINDAVSVELARAKIAANEAADKIQINLRSIEAVGMPLLFADLPSLVNKAPDDLAAVIDSRLAKFNAAEEERIAKELEARQKADAAIVQAQAPAPEAAPRITQISAMPPMPPAAVHSDSDALINLGEINVRLAPVNLSAGGLAELGFSPVKSEKGAKLYRDADYPDMVHAIVKRLVSSLQVQPA